MIQPKIPNAAFQFGQPVTCTWHEAECGTTEAVVTGIKGQLHVPGCDVERCPKCGSQAISCGCSRRA